MKKTTTLFLPPLIIGLMIAIFGLSYVGSGQFNAWQWCLAIVAVVLIGLLVGALLNFAVFAPVYWLLGRLHSRRSETRRTHEEKS